MTPKRHSTHVSATDLADHADGRSGAPASARIEAHVASCPSCAERLRAVTGLLGLMRADRMPEPPAPVVARAMRLFQPEPVHDRALAWFSGMAEIIGRLVFDSLAQPSFAAARGVMSGRRLRFEAAGLELDLLADRREGKGLLTGQLTRTEGELRPAAGIRFLVLAGGQQLASGETDAIGEFSATVDRLAGVRIAVIDGERAVTFPLPSNLDG